MAGGEVIGKKFLVVRDEPKRPPIELDIPSSRTYDCCSAFLVLAETSGIDYFKNDRTSFLYSYGLLINNAELVLQKCEEDWEDKALLIDNTYGSVFSYNFFEKDGNKYIGYLINWQNVLNAFGQGTYRIKTNDYTIFGETINNYSCSFDLKVYTPNRANKTVRFDFWNNGLLGDKDDDRYFFDYDKLNWFNQYRLPNAFFGYPKSSYERDYVRYQNGQQVWVQDEQIEEFSFFGGRYNDCIHKHLRVDLLQADRIEVTDYNSNNPNKFIKKKVKPNSNYEPTWNYGTKQASIELKFVSEFQNLKKKRC